MLWFINKHNHLHMPILFHWVTYCNSMPADNSVLFLFSSLLLSYFIVLFGVIISFLIAYRLSLKCFHCFSVIFSCMLSIIIASNYFLSAWWYSFLHSFASSKSIIYLFNAISLLLCSSPPLVYSLCPHLCWIELFGTLLCYWNLNYCCSEVHH